MTEHVRVLPVAALPKAPELQVPCLHLWGNLVRNDHHRRLAVTLLVPQHCCEPMALIAPYSSQLSWDVSATNGGQAVVGAVAPASTRPICIASWLVVELLANSCTIFLRASYDFEWFMVVCWRVTGSRIPTSIDRACISLTSSLVELRHDDALSSCQSRFESLFQSLPSPEAILVLDAHDDLL